MPDQWVINVLAIATFIVLVFIIGSLLGSRVQKRKHREAIELKEIEIRKMQVEDEIATAKREAGLAALHTFGKKQPADRRPGGFRAPQS